jgi:hypothetical protein
LIIPTLRVCNDPVAPIQFPMVWSPHLVAGLVFAATLLRPWQLRPISIAIRFILGATVVLVGCAAPPALLLIAIPLGIGARWSEVTIARCGVVAGIASSVWFGMISADHDALIGAYTSFAASIGLVIGSAWWWIEAAAWHTSQVAGQAPGQVSGQVSGELPVARSRDAAVSQRYRQLGGDRGVV